LYRTGDVAVRRADGTIEVLGRTDNQVKVRGHRIELEAVEAAVLRHPGVTAAAARTWAESTGELRLSVYIVAADDATAPSLADLRAFLQNSLPESMIPSDVIPLPAIPLTRHGKVDRPRLPAPSASQPDRLSSTPGSSEELRLAAIWADLLGRNHIGLDDNFFDMGGHSVLVAALQQRIATDIGLHIPVAELFHWPTVRQQAEVAQRVAKGTSVLPPGVHALQPFGTRSSIFWVHHLNRNLAKCLGDDQPFLSLVLTAGDLSSLGRTPTLQSIAACLRSKIHASQISGPLTIGGQCASGILAYEIAQQLRASGHDVSLLVLLDVPNPSYSNPSNWLIGATKYLRYGLKRARRLGLRVSLVYISQHLFKRLPRKVGTQSSRTEMRVAREMIEAAALSYQPEKYDGNVLLILASERPPHANFLPGWQAVVSGNLQACYLNAHHRNMLDGQNVLSVANAIRSHLISSTKKEPKLCRVDPSGPVHSGILVEVSEEMVFDQG
jgi:thioesterase domain-containing protein